MRHKVKYIVEFLFRDTFVLLVIFKSIMHCSSNHDRAPNTHVIRFLERHGIPYHYLPTSLGNKRENEILDLVKDTDFLVLARYMQVT